MPFTGTCGNCARRPCCCESIPIGCRQTPEPIGGSTPRNIAPGHFAAVSSPNCSDCCRWMARAGFDIADGPARGFNAMVPRPFNIRRGRPGDVDAVYEVCLHTGDNGADAAHLFDDPRALGHIFAGPYLKLEPELAFVLEDAQGLCGYALGALDSKRYYQAYQTKWLPEIRRRYPEPTGDPARWSRSQRVYYEYYHPDIFLPEPYDSYPSHLHIDLVLRAQGRGQGREMFTRLIRELA